MSKRRQRAIRQQKNEAASPQKTPKKGKISASSSTPRGSMTNWLLGLILILPFLYSRKPLDPVLSPRLIFLSVFILLFVTFFYIWRKKFIPVQSLQIKIVFGLGAAFGLWSLVGMSSAINYRESLFDLGRHFLLLILLYIVMTTVIQEESQLMKICKAVMLVSIAQSFVGILQYYELAFTDLPGNFKPYGLMSNRNFFGSAQVFLMPFVAYVLYKAGRFWKYAASLAMAGLVISVFISQTRSAWLSALVFFIVAALLVISFSAVNRKKWIIGSFAAIAISVAIISLIIFADKEGGLSEQVKQRAASLSGAAVDSSSAAANIDDRLKIWNKTIILIKDKPFTGVGLGNWKMAIPAYGTENMVFAKGFFAPDRPHNVYLQVAAETGLPGAVLYFGMWLMIALCGFKVVLRSGQEKIRILAILMLAGLAAVATDGMFSFPTDRIEHSVYMILMAGILLGCFANLSATDKVKSGGANKILLVPAIFILLFNIFLGFKKYEFEVHWKYARAYKQQGRYEEAIREARAGKNDFATMDGSGNPIEIFSMGAWMAMKNYDNAMKEISKAAKYNPNNSKIYNEWGTLYTEMKQYDKAIDNYKKALQLTPEFEITLKNLAVNYYLAEKYKECIETIGKINTAGDVEYWTNLLNNAKSRQK